VDVSPGANLDTTRLQRFSTKLTLIWTLTPSVVIAGYSINLATNTAISAYIIRTEALVAQTQVIYVVNMVNGFVVAGVDYQIRNTAGSVIAGALPRMQLTGSSTLSPYQSNLERASNGLYSVSAVIQFQGDQMNQPMLFSVLQNGVSVLSTQQSVDQKASTRTVNVSGVLTINPSDALSCFVRNVSAVTMAVNLIKLTMNVFPVG